MSEFDCGYVDDKDCSQCYWYSDATVQTCDRDHEPTKPWYPACDLFDPKDG